METSLGDSEERMALSGYNRSQKPGEAPWGYGSSFWKRNGCRAPFLASEGLGCPRKESLCHCMSLESEQDRKLALAGA